jgi:hypothetical protein
MNRRLLLTVFIAVAAFARVTSFKDVKCVYRENPKDDPGKADGMLHFDPTEKVMSFSSDNRVLVNIRYDGVTKITYQQKSGKLMTVYFTDTRGESRFAQFYLDGGNRDNILATVESQTGQPVQRL